MIPGDGISTPVLMRARLDRAGRLVAELPILQLPVILNGCARSHRVGMAVAIFVR